MLDNFQGKPNQKDIVTLIVILFIVLVFGLVWYAVCQVADVTVQILDSTAESIKDYTERRSRELEKLKREIDRLDRY